MTEIQPRFEFRAFGQGFGPIVERMRRRSGVERIRESAETYVVSRGNSENNTKIRFDTMDIKELVARDRGLEQWKPRMKAPFPIDAAKIRKEVFPAFGVELPDTQRNLYTLEQFLGELVAEHPELVAVDVFKRRFGFAWNGLFGEWAKVLVNGAAIQTICLESTDADEVLEARQTVGAEGMENVNYLLALKRVIGMEPLPAGFVPVIL